MSYTTRQITDLFVRGSRNSAHNSTKSLYFSGDVLYSYGPHFPLCVRVGGRFVVNVDRFSNSTSKHQNDIARSLRYDYIKSDTDSIKLLVSGDLEGFKSSAIKYHQGNIEKFKDKLTRVRSEQIQDHYELEISYANTQIKEIEELA